MIIKLSSSLRIIRDVKGSLEIPAIVSIACVSLMPITSSATACAVSEGASSISDPELSGAGIAVALTAASGVELCGLQAVRARVAVKTPRIIDFIIQLYPDSQQLSVH